MHGNSALDCMASTGQPSGVLCAFRISRRPLGSVCKNVRNASVSRPRQTAGRSCRAIWRTCDASSRACERRRFPTTSCLGDETQLKIAFDKVAAFEIKIPAGRGPRQKPFGNARLKIVLAVARMIPRGGAARAQNRNQLRSLAEMVARGNQAR